MKRPRHIARRIGGWLGFGLLLLAIYGAADWYRTRNAIHGLAPPIDSISLDGAAVSLKALSGQPALVHFWAEWCPICRFEQSTIDTLSQEYPVITVAVHSGSRDDVARHVADSGLQATVVVDEDGELAQQYGVSGVPTTFVIDGTGKIRDIEVGYTTAFGLRVRLWLAGR